MIGIEQIGFYKKGSGIHIKKKNRGKFTASAKRAGKSVLQHARDVLADPSATPLLKKRANFARNAAKWHKKRDGGYIMKGLFGIPGINKKLYDAGLYSVSTEDYPIYTDEYINKLKFMDRARLELNNMSSGLDKVAPAELNDSIQSNYYYTDNIDKFKTKVNDPNLNFFLLKSIGLYPLKLYPLYFDNFNSDLAKLIYHYGKSKGFSDLQLATIIEAGWRESNLGHKTNPAAHGVWLFDKPAGTYDKYMKWLGNRQDTWKTLFDYLTTLYMPSRDNGNNRTGYKKVWNNLGSSLEDLSTYFLMEVEAPSDRNKLLDRTKRAAQTIYTNLK